MYHAIALLGLEEAELTIQRRKLRDCTNVFELPDAEFVQNFRVDKEIFQYIFQDIKIYMKETYYSTHLPLQLKLSSFFRFLATGSYQKSIGNESVSFMAQTTVSFQRAEKEERAVKEHFHKKFGIPGVIGCLDGTHVRIRSPPADGKHLYYYRKGFNLIYVMAMSCKLTKIKNSN